VNRAPRGEINLVSLTLLALVAGAIYWAVLFGPKYLDHVDIKQAIHLAIAQKAQAPEEQLKDTLIRLVGDIAPDVELVRDDIQVEKDTDENTIFVSFEYQREVKLVPSEKVHAVTFEPAVKTKIRP